MINVTFRLERKIPEKLRTKKSYGVFSFSIYGDKTHLKEFEKPIKRCFKVKSMTNNIVDEIKYHSIQTALRFLITNKICNKMNLQNEEDVYHLMLYVDDKNYDSFKALLGDSSYATLTILDFKKK